MNEVLLYFSLKYQGNWKEIYDALDRKEKIAIEELRSVGKKIKSRYLTILDGEYPEGLKAIYKPPFLLFYLGLLEIFKNKKVLSISSNEEMVDDNILKELINEDVVFLISDSPECQKILEQLIDHNAKTILLLSVGIDNCDEDLIKRILDNKGLIISEFPAKTKPNVSNSEITNRIISGISKSLLVVSSIKKSSSISKVVDSFLEEGKNILTFTGQNNSLNNDLIKNGANLVEDAKDIISNLK